MITEERLKEILDNLKRYDDCWTKPTKNLKTFKEMQRKYNWIVLDDYKEKKDQVIHILERLGFKPEIGRQDIYWRYFPHLDLTVNFTLGEWYNNSYNCIACRASYQMIKGKVEQRSPRVGDRYYENGIMKTVTRAGVWTGD